MENSTLIIAILSLLISAMAVQTVSAEESVTYKLVSHEMTIIGTSTVHDWEADVTKVNADISIKNSNPDLSDAFTKLEITVPVKEIKSGRDGMDTRIHNALKHRDHSNITYKLQEISSTESTGSNEYTLASKGELTIAGSSKVIDMDVKAVSNDNGSYTFTGSYTTLMTDYNVDPPTAMMGTVRAGDEITINFSITVEPA